MSPDIKSILLSFQKNEITEYHIYKKLSESISCEHNKKILSQIGDSELAHAQFFESLTQKSVKPNRFKIWKYYLISKILGFTFGIKLMEKGEEHAQHHYNELIGKVDGIEKIINDENDHEEALIELLDEERLKYIGSVVLGLNDALVELTGALAGLTLALQNTQLIALSGTIIGIAAAFSMAASEYLSTKNEETEKHPIRASVYTGSAYIGTVILLILPYLLFSNYFVCLAATIILALLVIAFFNYYISVAKDENFKHRFLEMAGLSLGVALFSFLGGYVLRHFFGVEV